MICFDVGGSFERLRHRPKVLESNDDVSSKTAPTNLGTAKIFEERGWKDGRRQTSSRNHHNPALNQNRPIPLSYYYHYRQLRIYMPEICLFHWEGIYVVEMCVGSLPDKDLPRGKFLRRFRSPPPSR